ncbi:hypothetical protein AVEN_193947-1 [Araneus ventricosus]|uniref:Uncharacterized protein n=1 Tax=Araneus ventricosus TaxID=182803 RepID=A0A4Y2WQV4_ARAVE|nr:hypothetical protein AVEN_193947-1 [Araneus ventricosus]
MAVCMFSKHDFLKEKVDPKLNKQPTVVDILLKDMMHDQACLLRKLQIAEENRLKMEKAFKQSENKNKILSGLVRSMSGAVSA